jgi:hypothetical protein
LLDSSLITKACEQSLDTITGLPFLATLPDSTILIVEKSKPLKASLLASDRCCQQDHHVKQQPGVTPAYDIVLLLVLPRQAGVSR